MSDSSPSKLPIVRTAIDSIAMTFKNVHVLLGYAWPWIGVLVLVNGALYWGLYEREQAAIAAGSGGSLALLIATGIVSTVIAGFVAVPWHRFLILGERPAVNGLAISREAWLYAGYTLALYALFSLPFYAVMFASLDYPDESPVAIGISILSFFLFLLLWAVFNRFSLALPMIALRREDAGLKAAWAMTQGNSWRLFWSTIIIFVILIAVLGAPVMAYGLATATTAEGASMQSRLNFTLTNMLTEAVTIITGVIFVTFLSLAYKHFSGAGDQSAAKQ